MIKKLFFYGCFLFLVAVSVVSCRSEYDGAKQNEKPQTYTIIHNNTTLLNENATLSAKVNSFRQGSKNPETGSYLDDYEIFENQVTYVRNNDKDRESYAFYLREKSLPTDKFHLKNLVFSKLLTETKYSVQIVSYYLPDGIDKSSKNILVENVEDLDSETGLPNKNINGKSAGCGAEIIEVEHWCGVHLHYGAGAAADCHDGQKPYSTYIVLLGNCDGGGQGGGGGDPNDGSGNPGGPGGGTGSGGNGGHPVDTGLSLPPACETGDCGELIPNKINNILGSILSYDELLFLYDNPKVAQELYNKLYINKNYFTLENIVFGIKFLQENPDTANPEQIFARIKALDNLLTQNPDALLDIPCQELPNWKTVADQPIPVSVKNKLYQLNNQGLFTSAEIQAIETANAPHVNMDLFPVKITNMPNKPNGQKYTPAEFFDYFRKKINTFVNPDLSQFYPAVYPNYNINDTNLWNSSNPIGAILDIDILGPDNGSVVCTGSGPQAWVFSTIISPWYGLHPVNGNRLFGYFPDGNGGMTIYIRGVDRFTSLTGNSNFWTSLETLVQESIAFTQADKLWKSLQEGIKKFVKDNGGGESGASIVPPTIYRPNWTKVSAYIKGSAPLSTLGCH